PFISPITYCDTLESMYPLVAGLTPFLNRPLTIVTISPHTLYVPASISLIPTSCPTTTGVELATVFTVEEAVWVVEEVRASLAKYKIPRMIIMTIQAMITLPRKPDLGF